MTDMRRVVTGLPKPLTEDDDAPLIAPDKPSNVKRQTIYMPLKVHDQLRELSFNERKSQQQLIREALNMLFDNRGCPNWEDLK